MRKILIINGPNLNLLGKREPVIYGKVGFDEYLKTLRTIYPEVAIEYFQSNIEGEIIDALQESDGCYDGILLNAGGYTHTSVAIADAVRAIDTEVVEVHISCVFAREEYRWVSLIAPECKGTIMGFGLDSYRIALAALL